MKKLNYVFSVIMIAACAFFFFYSGSFKTLPGQMDVGPAAFPRVISVLLAVCAVANIVTTVRQEESEKVAIINVKLLIGIAVAVGYFLLMKPVGFLITSIIAIFILQCLLLNESFKKAWIVIVLVSILAPIAIQIVFGEFLKVPLPVGILKFILG